MKYEKDFAKKLLMGENKVAIEEYYRNKEEKIGNKIVCANCGKTFLKKNKQHTFCRLKCKDEFWNYMSEERFNRQIWWNRRKHEN